MPPVLRFSAKTIEGNVLTLRPALVISQQEMDQAIDIIDEVVGEVEQEMTNDEVCCLLKAMLRYSNISSKQ